MRFLVLPLYPVRSWRPPPVHARCCRPCPLVITPGQPAAPVKHTFPGCGYDVWLCVGACWLLPASWGRPGGAKGPTPSWEVRPDGGQLAADECTSCYLSAPPPPHNSLLAHLQPRLPSEGTARKPRAPRPLLPTGPHKPKPPSPRWHSPAQPCCYCAAWQPPRRCPRAGEPSVHILDLRGGRRQRGGARLRRNEQHPRSPNPTDPPLHPSSLPGACCWGTAGGCRSTASSLSTRAGRTASTSACE